MNAPENRGRFYAISYYTKVFIFTATSHDAIRKENAMPVEMVRAIPSSQPLKKDFTSQWRFYDK